MTATSGFHGSYPAFMEVIGYARRAASMAQPPKGGRDGVGENAGGSAVEATLVTSAEALSRHLY